MSRSPFRCPAARRLPRKTWNPRLGIVGGLSILGTTGIVRPFSCAAWIASIHRGIDVARAAGLTHVAGCTGATSETAVQALYGLPDHAMLDMGDFAGGLLKYLRRHPVPRLTIGGGHRQDDQAGAGRGGSAFGALAGRFRAAGRAGRRCAAGGRATPRWRPMRSPGRRWPKRWRRRRWPEVQAQLGDSGDRRRHGDRRPARAPCWRGRRMTLLLLAGTGEAREHRRRAGRWRAQGDGLAGRGHAQPPSRWPLPTRIGGFGGDDGLCANICASTGITAVLDATHPFADRHLSHARPRIAAERGLPYLQFLRPALAARPGRPLDLDRARGRRRRPYPAGRHGVSGHRAPDAGPLCQSRRAPRDLPPDRPARASRFPFRGRRIPDRAAAVLGRATRWRCSRDSGVDWLVVKNAGGEGEPAKLTPRAHWAFRWLMIRRPPPPEATLVNTVGQALAWVRRALP